MPLPTLVTLGLVLAGCTSPGVGPVRTEAALRDPDPAKKLRAIRQMVATNDTRHLDVLETLLEDRDLTVRFVAAKALARLTGRPATRPDGEAEIWDHQGGGASAPAPVAGGTP